MCHFPGLLVPSLTVHPTLAQVPDPPSKPFITTHEPIFISLLLFSSLTVDDQAVPEALPIGGCPLALSGCNTAAIYFELTPVQQVDLSVSQFCSVFLLCQLVSHGNFPHEVTVAV
jgi:hypothetical protein